MAQLVEQRIRNAWVAGSSPAIGSYKKKRVRAIWLFYFAKCLMRNIRASERRKFTLCRAQPKMPNAELAQLVEHWLPKPRVAGSSPVFRSTF